MSLQTIIDNATYVDVDIREISGSTLSRSGHYKTADRNINVYGFTFGMHDGLTYSTNRGVLQDIYTLGATTEANISLNNNSGMNYLTAYQGSLSDAQLDQLTIKQGASANQFYVDTTSVSGNVSGYTHLFKKGDYIQPLGNTSGYRYPYQVTSDVTWQVANVGIEVHRNVISQTDCDISSFTAMRVGNECRWHVKITNLPKYAVVPHDRLSFSDDFECIEVIT